MLVTALNFAAALAGLIAAWRWYQTTRIRPPSQLGVEGKAVDTGPLVAFVKEIALNSQLVEAEARRAERSPTPDSMDLHFQGQAWLNKGWGPDNVARAQSFFDRALSADPNNVDALVASAAADTIAGSTGFAIVRSLPTIDSAR
jgi:hypothetical protein